MKNDMFVSGTTKADQAYAFVKPIQRTHSHTCIRFAVSFQDVDARINICQCLPSRLWRELSPPRSKIRGSGFIRKIIQTAPQTAD